MCVFMRYIHVHIYLLTYLLIHIDNEYDYKSKEMYFHNFLFVSVSEGQSFHPKYYTSNEYTNKKITWHTFMFIRAIKTSGALKTSVVLPSDHTQDHRRNPRISLASERGIVPV